MEINKRLKNQREIKNNISEKNENADINKRTIAKKYRELALQAQKTLGTKESIQFFREKLVRRRVDHDTLLKNYKTTSTPKPGSMLVYTYDPKHKDKLPFYDTNPCIILLDYTKDGWYGANLHYLPPTARADLLMEIGWNKRVSLFNIAKALETNKLTKHCLKRKAEVASGGKQEDNVITRIQNFSICRYRICKSEQICCECISTKFKNCNGFWFDWYIV